MSLLTPRRRSPTIVAGLVVVATMTATLTSCSSSDAPADPATTSATAPASPTPEAVDVPALSVTLIDPGQDPRRPLALQLTPESPQRVTLTTQAGIVQQIGKQDAVDLSSPAISVPLTTATTPGEPAATVGLTVGTPTSPDSILTEALTKESGARATVSVTPNAAITALSITPNDAALDTARSAVEQALRQAVQLAVALPADPVGVGARWNVSQQLNSLGLPLRQDVSVTLTSIDGPRVVLAVTLAQTPLSNTWTVPGGGGQLSVDSYPMQGTGTLTLDLAAPLPVAGSLTLAGKQVYTRQADELVLSQDVTNRVGWAS